MMRVRHKYILYIQVFILLCDQWPAISIEEYKRTAVLFIRLLYNQTACEEKSTYTSII